MQRHRFYSPPGMVSAPTIRLSAGESHHLTRVVRLRPGDEAFVFDGVGHEFRCLVMAGNERQVELEIVEKLADEVESPVELTLAQALAKGDKFDLIIQKATELGVRRILPLITANSDVKLTVERGDKRAERWRRISLEALKQSGGRRLVELHLPAALPEYLASFSARETNPTSPALLVFSERGGMSIPKALAQIKEPRVIAFVGPEGGWTGPEMASFESIGAAFVTLGPRILRTETAAITAVSLIQHRLGDLSRD